MYTRRFFRIALLLPLLFIAAGLAAALAENSELYTHLILTLLIPYSVFTVAAGIVSRISSPHTLRSFGFRGPILFLFLLMGYLSLEYAFNVSIASNPAGLVAIMIFSATYTVIFGYLYILILQQALISYLYQQKQKRTYKSGVLYIDGKAVLPI
jgi:predicted branched-subunit amino acid permease